MRGSRLAIALFMHDLSGGGVERMRLRLAAGLLREGHAVTLIVQRARGNLWADIPDGVALVELGHARTWASIARLAAVLRERQPDILLSSLDHNNIAALCARLLAGSRTKVVICQHNALSAEAAMGWRYRVVPLLYRLLARWADGIVAVSAGVAADLSLSTGIPRTRVTVIHNPITDGATDFLPMPPPHPWMADHKVPVFLFVGRLVAQKDPALLMRGFALRLRHGQARLIFLGEGPNLSALRAQADELGVSDAVHFGGFVADPRPWMAHAAALVVPSRYEGFGNVLVEALSCGTPVIATDCPHGPNEILAGGRFGWLVPVGDTAALAHALCDDARGSFPAARLRRRAENYSVSACVAGHKALFDSILGTRRRRQAFGLEFSTMNAEEVCAHIVDHRPTDTIGLIVTPNLDHVRLLRQQPEFAEACSAAEIICPDGFPVAAYGRLRGVVPGMRVTGCDIFRLLANGAPVHRRKVLVVAESAETQLALQAWAAVRGLDHCWRSVVAPKNLMRDSAGRSQLLAAIGAVRPDILVMSLGAPVSELFVHRHRTQLPPCWALCCGQAVRVELGLDRRAPKALRWLNLEWGWRFVRDPRRLGPRYVRDALIFPTAVMADLLAATDERQIDVGSKVKLTITRPRESSAPPSASETRPARANPSHGQGPLASERLDVR